MNDPITGEIRLVAFDSVPDGWAVCDGRLLPVSQHRALHKVLGARYGGDGRRTFALPDLSGRVAIHTDAAYPLGASGGEATHALSVDELPTHRHLLPAATSGAQADNASGYALAASGGASNSTAGTLLELAQAEPSGAASGHTNMQPYLGLVFIIALDGRLPAGG